MATLPNADRKLGFLHASYGLGAALCPLAATAFASHYPTHFTKFWSISLGIALLNTAVLLYAFRFSYVVDTSEPSEETEPSSPRTENALEAQTPPLGAENSSMKSFGAGTPSTTYPPELRTAGLRKVQATKEKSLVKQALLSRTTIIASLYILF